MTKYDELQNFSSQKSNATQHPFSKVTTQHSDGYNTTMRQHIKVIQNSAIRLLPRRQVSTGILPGNELFSVAHRKFTPSFLNRFTFIDTKKQAYSYHGKEQRLIAQRDGPTIIDRVSNASSDAKYEQHVQPLVNYVNPVTFLNEELACISNGLTNLELRIEDGEGKDVFIETDLLRRLGKHTFRLALINQFRIFKNVGYLSNSETDIESDIIWLLDNSPVIEFMKLNGLSKCVSLNRELLINENLTKSEFEAKKKVVFNATAIGSFHTMIGLIHFNPRSGLQELMDKIINGKRGVYNILKQSA